MVADGTGEIGAAKLTEEVMEVMSKVPLLVEKMTGVNIQHQTKKG